MTNWVAFFNELSSSRLHREQAALYVEALAESVGVGRVDRVLDFGCGFGFVAARLAPLVREVWLWDASPNMRSIAARNTAGLSNVRPCDLAAVAELPSDTTPPQVPSMDLILVNSVTQYMTSEELNTWLLRWQHILAPGGQVVLSDLIPPRHSGAWDLLDLLRFGALSGSPLRATADALGGIMNYWRMRRAAPLMRIGTEDLARRAAAADLDVVVLPRNLTHFARRWAAVLRCRAPLETS